jgi:isovaleryl-CoA dehydrogenase
VDFDLTDEQVALRDAIRQFAEAKIRPLAEQMDQDDIFPPDLWPRLGGMGLLGIGVPEALGGSGGSLMNWVIAGEEVAACSSAVALSMGAHGNLCVWNLYRNGNQAQRERWLPELCAGTKVGSLCITEPDTGSDAVGIQTRAVRDGDDYLLTGTKTWITNAPIADLFIVYAKTDPEAGPRGITAFVVERDTPGLSTSKPFDKMGCRGSPTGQVFFDGARVPAENVLGQVNRGINVLMSGLDVERAVFAALPLGQARRAMELSLRYAKERSQFGRPIANFQLIQAKLADMYTQTEAARLMVWKAGSMLGGMERGGKGTELHKLAAAALLFSAEAAEKVCYEAVQIHGGNGYSKEFEVNRLYRDVRLGTIGAGTSEIRRLIIARELLGT